MGPSKGPLASGSWGTGKTPQGDSSSLRAHWKSGWRKRLGIHIWNSEFWHPHLVPGQQVRRELLQEASSGPPQVTWVWTALRMQEYTGGLRRGGPRQTLSGRWCLQPGDPAHAGPGSEAWVPRSGARRDGEATAFPFGIFGSMVARGKQGGVNRGKSD